MDVFNSFNTKELKTSLLYEIIMRFIIEKHCYNKEYSSIFWKYMQNSIDNCPFTEYTYSVLKHIC